MFKIFDWFFCLIGLFFIGSLLHELIHFFNCGGSFVAGLAYLNGWYVANTWCERISYEREIIPTVLEVLFYIVFIGLKVKT